MCSRVLWSGGACKSRGSEGKKKKITKNLAAFFLVAVVFRACRVLFVVVVLSLPDWEKQHKRRAARAYRPELLVATTIFIM